MGPLGWCDWGFDRGVAAPHEARMERCPRSHIYYRSHPDHTNGCAIGRGVWQNRPGHVTHSMGRVSPFDQITMHGHLIAKMGTIADPLEPLPFQPDLSKSNSEQLAMLTI